MAGLQPDNHSPAGQSYDHRDTRPVERAAGQPTCRAGTQAAARHARAAWLGTDQYYRAREPVTTLRAKSVHRLLAPASSTTSQTCAQISGRRVYLVTHHRNVTLLRSAISWR